MSTLPATATDVAFHKTTPDRFHAPAIITLAMLDENQDFEPLEILLTQKRPDRCERIEFMDDNRDSGKRWLKYNASIQYATGRGTESRWETEPIYETVTVFVEVRPNMDIDIIARLLISEIEAEIDNALNY